MTILSGHPQPLSTMSYQNTKKPNDQVKNGLFILSTGQLLILSESTELQVRLLVTAQTSASGHRGRSATISALESRFHWET